MFPPAAYDLSTREPLYIGFGAVDYFSGTIDDLRIYNRGITAIESQSLLQQLPEPVALDDPRS